MLKLRDYLILAAAFIAFVLSVWLWFSRHSETGIFVAIWVPSILAFGTYVNTRINTRQGGR